MDQTATYIIVVKGPVCAKINTLKYNNYNEISIKLGSYTKVNYQDIVHRKSLALVSIISLHLVKNEWMNECMSEWVKGVCTWVKLSEKTRCFEVARGTTVFEGLKVGIERKGGVWNECVWEIATLVFLNLTAICFPTSPVQCCLKRLLCALLICYTPILILFSFNNYTYTLLYINIHIYIELDCVCVFVTWFLGEEEQGKQKYD